MIEARTLLWPILICLHLSDISSASLPAGDLLSQVGRGRRVNPVPSFLSCAFSADSSLSCSQSPTAQPLLPSSVKVTPCVELPRGLVSQHPLDRGGIAWWPGEGTVAFIGADSELFYMTVQLGINDGSVFSSLKWE